MKKYLLDTNIVSLAVRGNNHVLKHLTSVPMSELCISAITHAELMYGLAKRPEARRLHRLVYGSSRGLRNIPSRCRSVWSQSVCARYADCRARTRHRSRSGQ